MADGSSSVRLMLKGRVEGEDLFAAEACWRKVQVRSALAEAQGHVPNGASGSAGESKEYFLTAVRVTALAASETGLVL